MDPRRAGLLTALIAAGSLGFAFFTQYGLHFQPCELCLVERWPYRFALVLGILAMVMGRNAGRLILAVAGMVMLVNVGIAGLHAGVEFHWWASPFPECNIVLTPGVALPLVPGTSCGKGVYPLPWLPMTMTQMDFCWSILFSVFLFFTALKPKRHS